MGPKEREKRIRLIKTAIRKTVAGLRTAELQRAAVERSARRTP